MSATASIHYSPDLARKYAEHRDQYNETDKALFDGLVTIAVEGKDVLDLGCGDGRHAEMIKGMGAKSVSGIDVNETMIELAKKRRRVSFQVASGDNLPFKDASFDMVFSNFVLHYFKDTFRVIAEVARVLRPGGHFVGTFNITDVEKGHEGLFNTEMPIRLGKDDRSVIVRNLIKSRSEIMSAIDAAGLTVRHEEELDHPNATVDDSFEHKSRIQKHAVMMVLEKKA
jgi:ubiquinone/menaquinone biosynthesis C-methylase UbiE